MIDEIIAKVKEEERKKILDDMHKRQVEKETIRYVFIANFDALYIRKYLSNFYWQEDTYFTIHFSENLSRLRKYGL